MILIYDLCLVFSCLNVNIADKKGNLVILVQAVPEKLCKGFHVIRHTDQFRLALEAGKRISISHISVDEMPFPCRRILICKCIPVAAVRAAVIAL